MLDQFSAAAEFVGSAGSRTSEVNRRTTPWEELPRSKKVDGPWARGGSLGITSMGRRQAKSESTVSVKAGGGLMTGASPAGVDRALLLADKGFGLAADSITDSTLEQKLFGTRRRGVYHPPTMRRSKRCGPKEN